MDMTVSIPKYANNKLYEWLLKASYVYHFNS